MADYKASASISVKRLRTGVTVTLSLVNTGGALFQTVNDDGTSIIPNWAGDESARPILTPTASAGSSTAKISNGEWYYNGTLLVFNGDTMGNYVKDTVTGKFACDPSTYVLTIIDNLASADNYSNDTLEFRCTVTYDDVPYEMSRSVAVTIMKATTSSYYGFLYGDTTLTNEQQSGFLRAYLLGAAGYVTGFTVRLYKNVVDGDPWKTTSDDNTGYIEWAIGVDDIDSSTLFIAQFLLGDTVVATAGLKVMDATDPLDLALTTEGNAELSEGNPVNVVAKLVDKDGVSGYPMKSITFTVLDNDLNEWRSVTNSGETTAAYFTVLFSDSVAGNDPVIVAVADYEI